MFLVPPEKFENRWTLFALYNSIGFCYATKEFDTSYVLLWTYKAIKKRFDRKSTTCLWSQVSIKSGILTTPTRYLYFSGTGYLSYDVGLMSSETIVFVYVFLLCS